MTYPEARKRKVIDRLMVGRCKDQTWGGGWGCGGGLGVPSRSPISSHPPKITTRVTIATDNVMLG